MKRLTKKLVAALSLAALLGTQAAFAGGTWTTVTVSQVNPWSTLGFSGGIVLVQFSASSTGGASCASGAPTWGAVSLANAYGAYIASILQSARLTGSTITVHGTGSCTLDSGFEDISNVNE